MSWEASFIKQLEELGTEFREAVQDRMAEVLDERRPAGVLEQGERPRVRLFRAEPAAGLRLVRNVEVESHLASVRLWD